MTRLFSLLGIAVFAAFVALLHILESSYAPTTSAVSEYVLGQYGWVMTVAFFALASGSSVLTQTLQPRHILTLWDCGSGRWERQSLAHSHRSREAGVECREHSTV